MNTRSQPLSRDRYFADDTGSARGRKSRQVVGTRGVIGHYETFTLSPVDGSFPIAAIAESPSPTIADDGSTRCSRPRRIERPRKVIIS